MKTKANLHDAVCNPGMPWPDLIIDDSDIEGAGKGLFSNKLISKGLPVCEYKGDLLSSQEVIDLSPKDQLYVLALGDPPMASLSGKILTCINADPEKAKEIGYGGFANDLNTNYPETLIKAINEHEHKGIEFLKNSTPLIKSLNFNKKLPLESRRKLKKQMKALTRSASNLKSIYLSYGYNALYERISGLPCFMLISIKDIYPGDEIYVPYGFRYWQAFNKSNEQKTDTKN